MTLASVVPAVIVPPPPMAMHHSFQVKLPFPDVNVDTTVMSPLDWVG